LGVWQATLNKNVHFLRFFPRVEELIDTVSLTYFFLYFSYNMNYENDMDINE